MKTHNLEKENIFIMHSGDVLALDQDSAEVVDKVQTGAILVDGLGVGDVGNIVLRDRQHLAEDGIMIVVMTLDRVSGELVAGPDIVSRGFVYVRESDELIEEASNIATIKYDPNFNEIRNRYPTRIPEIIKAVKSNKYRIEGDNAILDIGGTEEAFDKNIILVTYIAKEGLFVASQNGIVVSLDLTITEDLRTEGLAREIVRNIQDTRKKIGCEIMDKIIIYSPDKGLFPSKWMEYICAETMSIYQEIDEFDSEIVISTEDNYTMKILVKKKV